MSMEKILRLIGLDLILESDEAIQGPKMKTLEQFEVKKGNLYACSMKLKEHAIYSASERVLYTENLNHRVGIAIIDHWQMRCHLIHSDKLANDGQEGLALKGAFDRLGLSPKYSGKYIIKLFGGGSLAHKKVEVDRIFNTGQREIAFKRILDHYQNHINTTLGYINTRILKDLSDSEGVYLSESGIWEGTQARFAACMEEYLDEEDLIFTWKKLQKAQKTPEDQKAPEKLILSK